MQEGNMMLTFEEHDVRMPTIDPPTWMATDVGRVLEITNVSEAIADFDDDEKHNIDKTYVGQSGGRDPWVLTEPGLYRLINKSRKDAAKRFRRWINHEVLPSIRRHGCYPAPKKTKDQTIPKNELQAIVGAVMTEFRDYIVGLESAVVKMSGAVRDLASQQNEMLRERRKELTDRTKERHIAAVNHFGGLCPCCGCEPIVASGKRIPHKAQFDHFFLRSMNRVWETWLVCVGCNTRLRGAREEEGRFWIDSVNAFGVYQQRREVFENGTQGTLPFCKS